MKKIFFLIALLATGCFSACQDSSDVSAGNGYKFVFNPRGGHTALINGRNAIQVGEHILIYKFDEKFIVISQKPDQIFIDCMNSKDDYDNCKSDFEKSDFKQFWILNKENGIKYGPFTKVEYDVKFRELKISEKLNLSQL